MLHGVSKCMRLTASACEIHSLSISGVSNRPCPSTYTQNFVAIQWEVPLSNSVSRQESPLAEYYNDRACSQVLVQSRTSDAGDKSFPTLQSLVVNSTNPLLPSGSRPDFWESTPLRTITHDLLVASGRIWIAIRFTYCEHSILPCIDAWRSYQMTMIHISVLLYICILTSLAT